MMKKFLTKTLLVAVCLLGGANFAWGTTTVVGATNNSDGAYYTDSHYARYTLAPGKQIKIEFTVSTATDEQLGGTTWQPWFAWAVNFWDGINHAITIEPRDYGWEDQTDNTRWTANWAQYWAQNYPSGWETGTAFRDIIQNATVVTTMKRVDNQVIIIYDITTEGGQKYRQYAVKEYGGGNNTITFDLVVSHTHITIDDDKTITTNTDAVTGTLVGKLNRTGRLGDHGVNVDFTLAPEKSLNLKFKSYNNHIAIWGTWLVELQHDTDYYDVVSGNKNSWGSLNVAETKNTTGYPATDAAVLDAFDGATVDLTVSRSGATVNISATITPISGDEMTLTSSITPTKEGFATSDITVRPLVELGYLDILPVTAIISSYGWATFSSDYALDFSKATEGLEAYMITGHEGNVVTKAQVTGTVPANTGLLLKGAAGNYTVPIVGSSSTDVSANLLVAGTGASVSAEEGKTKYVLGVSASSEAEFQKIVSTPATVATGKAYLEFNEVISARSMRFEGDEITGIENVVAAPAEATLMEGKFIENGKLVIVKNGMKFNAAGQQMK